RAGLPLVAYTRWNSGNFKSQLLLSRINAKGGVSTTRITAEGFPQSYVPPPAEPVIVGGRVHVLESYGYRGTVATFEWFPQKHTWAGTIVHRRSIVELDGWLAGLAVAPRGARDVLLGGAAGLNWYRSPRRLTTRVTIEASDQGDGTVDVSGGVSGVGSGKVVLYRERPSEKRVAVATVNLSGGAFSFVDDAPVVRPILY